MIECVVNVSEGCSRSAVQAIASSVSEHLFDLHVDPHHNRSVFTLLGDDLSDVVINLCATAFDRCDLRQHRGVHPRLGVVDVIPFVALGEEYGELAVHQRDRVAAWLADSAGVPVFSYGNGASDLPRVRREAFVSRSPDRGPREPDPRKGASCLGIRGPLVAYNVEVDATVEEAKRVTRSLRGESVRALTFAWGDTVQISLNLVDPARVGPVAVAREISRRLPIRGYELVGLVPDDLLDLRDPLEAQQRGIDATATIGYRLVHGFDPRGVLERMRGE